MQTNIVYSITGVVATIFSVAAFVPYVLSIFKNETRPSGASWWTWAILTIITVLSSKVAGAPWPVLILPIWLCLSQLGVAILSIKKGDKNWDLLNKFCVGGALAGIGLWIVTGEPLLALFISIIADFLASIPNYRHAFKNPEQENKLGWSLGFGSAILEVLAVKSWSIAESSWAIYFLINMGIAFFLVWRPMFKKLIIQI